MRNYTSRQTNTQGRKSVQFSCSVVSDSLQPHEQQHVRLPCRSPTSRVQPNPFPLSQWCHPTISSTLIPVSSCLQSFPASGSFQMSVLHIRWPKYWSFSFSINPSNEYSGLISFRMDWLDPFPIWNQSVVPCPVLTVASWPAYRFLKRQVRWSGMPISFRIFHSFLWSTE